MKIKRRDIIILGVLLLAALALVGYLVLSGRTPGRLSNSALDKAQAYVTANEFDKAIMAYTTIIKSGQDLARAYAGRGDAYMRERKFDEAIRDYSASLAQVRVPVVLVSRCNAYQLLQKFDQALADCKAAAEMDPKMAEAHIMLGVIALAKNDLDTSRKEYDQAIALDPKSAKAYYLLSQIEIESGNLDKSIEALGQAIKMEPKNPFYYWERGFLYISAGKVAESKADMYSVLKYGNAAVDGELMMRAGTMLRTMGENVN
jgi:tetratricopeptide (TPR) repeat protein